MSYGELSNTQETMVLPMLQMKNIRGKPYITVSAKGMINGLSNIPNDGADFGPDTTKGATALGQYGGTYTDTYGWQETFNYIASKGGGSIYFKAGVYNFTNAPVQTAPVSGSACKVYFPVIAQPNYYGMQGVKFIFETPYWLNGVQQVEFTPDIAGYGVIVYDNQPSPSSSSDGYNEILFDSTSSPSNRSMIQLETEGTLAVYVPLSFVSAITFGNIAGIEADTFVVATLSPTGNNLTSYNNSASGSLAHGISTPSVGAYYPLHFKHINAFYFSGAGVDLLSGSVYIDFLETEANIIGIWITNGLSPVHIINWMTQADYVALQVQSSGYAKMIVELMEIYNPQYSSLTPQNTFAYVSGSNVDINILNWDSSNDSTFLPTFNSSWPAGSTKINPKSMQGQSLTLTTPSVPTSGTAQENTNPYAVDVYVYGGDVTEIQITKGGTAYTVFSVSTAIAMSGQAYKLNPGDSITVTYSTAPTWEWLSD